MQAAPAPTCGGTQGCTSLEYGTIAGVVNGGNGIGAISGLNVAHVGDVGGISSIVTIPAATSPVMTWTLGALTGCTSGTPTTQSSAQMYSYEVSVTLTDTTCTGTLRSQITAGVSNMEIWDWVARFTIQAEQVKDNLNRFCAASATGAACATPHLTVDAQARVCGESAIGAACEAYNPILSSFAVLASLILFVALVLWAESTGLPLFYAAATIYGALMVASLWSELESLRMLLIGVVLLVAFRGYAVLTEDEE